jgi:hypothetical protein
MSKGMQFVATHNVTAHDVARAAQLGARRVDLLLSVIVVVVIVGILAEVLYSFGLYLSAVAEAPEKLVGLLRFESGDTGVAVLSWLSILVSLSLPVFLFYAIRSLADTLHPAWRVRRLIKNSDIIGPTTYTIDDRGVRSLKEEGADVFLPWTTFNGVRSNAEIVVLFSNNRPKFFVPLGAFGLERDEVLAAIRSRVSRSGKSNSI